MFFVENEMFQSFFPYLLSINLRFGLRWTITDLRFVALSFALSVGDNVDADDADDDDDDDVVVVAVVVFVVSDDDDDDGLEFPVAAAVKCCCIE